MEERGFLEANSSISILKISLNLEKNQAKVIPLKVHNFTSELVA